MRIKNILQYFEATAARLGDKIAFSLGKGQESVTFSALLAQSRVALSSIPDQTGYKSLTDLQRVFKRQTGLTMREYRKALLISKSEV